MKTLGAIFIGLVAAALADDSTPLIAFDHERIVDIARREACIRDPRLDPTNLTLLSISYTWSDDLRRKYIPEMLTNRTEYIQVSFQLADSVTNRGFGIFHRVLDWKEAIIYLDLQGRCVEMKPSFGMYPIRPDVETNWINELPNKGLLRTGDPQTACQSAEP